MTATATKTSLKNLCFFNLYLDYSNSVTLSNAKKSSGAEFLITICKFRKRKTISSSLFLRPQWNEKLGIFTSYLFSDGKDVMYKAWCTCKVVVLPIQPVALSSKVSEPPYVYNQVNNEGSHGTAWPALLFPNATKFAYVGVYSSG